MKNYRAICFDFDYTLADATDPIVAGFQFGIMQLGFPAPTREQVRQTIGFILEDAYTMLTGDDNVENRAKFRPLFLQVSKQRQREETVLFTGAQELLCALHEQGVKLAIVSTKRGDTIEYVMQRLKLFDTLEFVIGSEQVLAPKPDPQGLQLAMQRMSLSPAEILFCGDTVLDAGAARNAGCDFCAVLNGTTTAQAFEEFQPIHLASDLWDLKDWLMA